MSYDVFFMFSQGLTAPMQVPFGTVDRIMEQVGKTEEALGFKVTKYLDNPPHWEDTRNPSKEITDDVYCDTVLEHNEFVRRLYEELAHWSAHPPQEHAETLTPEDAQKFWHGLTLLAVPVERWTKDYYRDRMEHLYEVMRGRPNQGVSFDEKALSPAQASEVVLLFSEYLDHSDIRLAVPLGHDYLAASYDGGYEWCEQCGAILYEDARVCKKRKCPLRAEIKMEEGE